MILEEITYKLDIYNPKVSKNLFDCQKGEVYCESMISKLVFFDRDQMLQMHTDSLFDGEVKYDASVLEQRIFPEKDLIVDRVLPLESNWIAVIFRNKNTNEIVKNKLMYITSTGDGYYSNDFEPALKGSVPKELYIKYATDYPSAHLFMDKKYFDGSHDDFVEEIYVASKPKILEIAKEILEVDSVKIEEILQIISDGYKKREDTEYFNKIKRLEFMYIQFGLERILEFDKNKKLKTTGDQPGEN